MADIGGPKLSRRNVVKTGAALAAAAPLAGAPLAKFNRAAAQDIPDVPREQTLILRWGSDTGQYTDHELWNGYAIGANHQNGLGLFYEPLAFYSAFADETIPWLAKDWAYNEDSTQLTINLREGVNWSDGTPFSADDVAYTINTVRDYDAQVRFGPNVSPFVEEATAETPTQVIVKFKIPSPRFMYFMTYKYDVGLYIVPKHVYEGQDWTKFGAYDMAKGWPVTTGPWRLAFTSPEQKVIDLADSWWALDQGLVTALPQVQRILYLPFPPGQEEQVLQQLINNEIDCSLDLRPLNMEAVLDQNPAIITHTGREKPWGYVDWWPTSLYVNHEREPYNDPNVRWALSYFIDRQTMIDVALGGSGSSWPLPVPSYPGLQPYIDSVKDLLTEYDTLEYNPDKGAAKLTESGWAKNGDYWEKDGKRLSVPIEGFTIFNDIGPVIAEMLKQNGVESEYSFPTDYGTRFNKRDYNGGLYGHGGSVSGDPYFTLVLYQSRSLSVPGQHQANFTGWVNDEYDKIVDTIGETPIDDQATLIDLWHQAMAIWIPDLVDIPIQEWYHRIPMNTTYWQGWPDQDHMYVNGAFWHLTFQLILNKLTPTP